MTRDAILFGVDRLALAGPRAGGPRRLGMITNDAAATARVPAPLTPSRQALLSAGFEIVTLFAPEHGIGAAAANGARLGDATDPLTGLPVQSLYGTQFRPTREALAGLDAVVYDLPNVGVRFWTYMWTLSLALEACAEMGIPLWVLDRPNPLGGSFADVEGPVLDESVAAGLVGRWSMPIRHSLTYGELARLWNAERGLGADLTVVAVEGWDARPRWPALGIPFVPQSPAMPSYENAVLYPGTCFLEGLAVSEGRGTAVPFRVAGAPWVDGKRLADALNDGHVPGAVARPLSFTPSASKFAGQECAGVMLHVTDEDVFRPVAAGLRLVALLWMLHPKDCAWATYRSASNTYGTLQFDRLVGRTDIRPAIERAPAEALTMIADWTTAPGWAARAKPHLLYPGASV